MSSIATTDRGAEVLARIIMPEEGNLPIEAARAILRFRLAPADWERVNTLAAKARAGTLTPLGGILKAALRAVMAQRCPAAAAKIHALRIVQRTARAAHVCFLMGDGGRAGLHRRKCVLT
jgi:hypothetical protein